MAVDPAPSRVLVSAHRGGAGKSVALQNTLAAVRAAVAMGADFVEMDVRRRPDGTFVLSHDPLAPGDDGAHLPTYDDVLAALGPRTGAHIDMKEAGTAVALVSRALEVLGDPDRVLLTTGDAAVVGRLRAWAQEHHAPIHVALTVGIGWNELLRRTGIATLGARLFPHDDPRATGADVLCAQYPLALLTLRRLARRDDLRLLVWTVDAGWLLRWWLRPGRAWMVTTNHPERALPIRRDLERLRDTTPAVRRRDASGS
jgi:glycerophosphoryl diester phosphodiesterase